MTKSHSIFLSLGGKFLDSRICSLNFSATTVLENRLNSSRAGKSRGRLRARGQQMRFERETGRFASNFRHCTYLNVVPVRILKVTGIYSKSVGQVLRHDQCFRYNRTSVARLRIRRKVISILYLESLAKVFGHLREPSMKMLCVLHSRHCASVLNIKWLQNLSIIFALVKFEVEWKRKK